MARSPHEIVNPPQLLPPVGFSHAVVSGSGRTVHVGGQTGHRGDGSLPHGLLAQFDQAAANLAIALAAAGARPEHLVSMQVVVTDAEAYRADPRALGATYQRHLGRHYPAMALFEVSQLFDEHAMVELVAVAVVPDGHG
ncbi:MAG TPA: Rid family hydrolase [Euzebyales bacterium]|nr:Rid family hydrolase [Euzebyales bacterium]